MSDLEWKYASQLLRKDFVWSTAEEQDALKRQIRRTIDRIIQYNRFVGAPSKCEWGDCTYWNAFKNAWGGGDAIGEPCDLEVFRVLSEGFEDFIRHAWHSDQPLLAELFSIAFFLMNLEQRKKERRRKRCANCVIL